MRQHSSAGVFNLYPKNHNPGTEAVREIRDEIKARVEALLTELLQ